MPGVFISYRREDCPGHAGRLYDRLVERFGAQRVFIDIDAIEPGVDFGERIEQAVGSCDVLLAMIGREWLTAEQPDGRRRLDDPSDFVRMELAAGLQRDGLRVIPVLVEGAQMPRADELPDDLKPLARRNAIELSDARWRYDVSRLAEVLARVIGRSRARPRERPRVSVDRRRRLPRRALVAAAATLGAALVVVVLVLAGGGSGGGPGTSAAKAIVGPVAVGHDAGRPAFGAGFVWVPVASEAAVARVDPRTLRVDKFRAVGDYPDSVSTGEGAVWVADSGGDRVTRLDARTGAVSDPIGVGDYPNDIAVGEGFVWTANCACESSTKRFSVSRIDPRTLAETRIPMDGKPIGIGTGDGSAWVTQGGDDTVLRIDPRAPQVVGDPIHVGDWPADVVADGSGIWVALQGEANSVVRIDPRTLRPGRRISVGRGPAALAFGGGFLWVADDDGTLRRVDPRRQRVVGAPLRAGRKLFGVAYGAGRAWVADEKSGALRGVAP